MTAAPMVVKLAGAVILEIHRTDDGEYVIADQAGWLPGAYPSIRDAVRGWLREASHT